MKTLLAITLLAALGLKANPTIREIRTVRTVNKSFTVQPDLRELEQMHVEELACHFANRRDLDCAQVLATIQKESSFNPDAVGDGGASLGLMQIKPKYYMEFCHLTNKNQFFDSATNISCGTAIIKEHRDNLVEQGWEPTDERIRCLFRNGGVRHDGSVKLRKDGSCGNRLFNGRNLESEFAKLTRKYRG